MKKAIYILLSSVLLVLGFCNIKILTAQTVNHFTGNLSHSIDLLTIPSPDGPPISISAHYSAGISVNQSASDIGLGWQLGVGGAVSRSVNEFPDDWNAILTNDDDGKLKRHFGVLYYKEHDKLGTYLGETRMDVYTSGYKITDEEFDFQFPAYDFYNVSGPGLYGMMEPNLFEFGTLLSTQKFNKQFTNYPSGFTKPVNFRFINEFSGLINSRHYPSSIYDITQFKLPDQSVNGSTEAFEGVHPTTGETYYEPATNRMVSVHYVEYFTNLQIHNRAGYRDPIYGFLDYTTILYSRIDTSRFDPTGIGALRVTDANGTVYHYSLPVYAFNKKVQTYPLDNNYNLHITEQDTGKLLIQNTRYATAWLLTAVTGADYKDNGNNYPDKADKGYWVRYEYALWSEQLNKRTPYYGYAYNFSPKNEEDDPTINWSINQKGKHTGRQGYFSSFDYEVYYLNRISTSTHSALFVRDIRLEEHATILGAEQIPDTASIHNNNNKYKTFIGQSTSWKGVLYDFGGPDEPIGNEGSGIYTITPTNADYVILDVKSFECGMFNTAYLEIYDGADETAPLIGRYGSCKRIDCPGIADDPNNYCSTTYLCDITLRTPPSTIQSTGNSITIKLVHKGSNYNYDDGFEIHWKPAWYSGHPPATPQLKLNQIILLNNAAFEGDNKLPAPGNLTTSDPRWDLTHTTANSNEIYTQQWYEANKATIEPLILRSVQFTQEYSLSKKYHNNINTLISEADKQATPLEVQASATTSNYTQSGMLTLKEITFYEMAHTHVTPSHIFDYNSGDKNPDFNPNAVDYWGYFKKDVTTTAYSSYTTLNSANAADAWALVKITEPLGAEVEIEYEPDTYRKAGTEEGFKGSVRTYAIKNATPITSECGTGWNVEMEDDVIDLNNLLKSKSSDIVAHAVIPFYEGTHSGNRRFLCSGTFTAQVDDGKKKLLSVSGLVIYEVENGETLNSSDLSPCDDTFFKYTGNGYISFQLPIGQEVYGGGLRTKRITTSNEACEAYTTRYTYGGGVATIEPDRFDLPEQKVDEFGNSNFIKLRSYKNDNHKMAPMVSYSKVITENVSKDNRTNGKVVYQFINSDEEDRNFDANIVKGEYISSANSTSTYCEDVISTEAIIEVEDAFTTKLGKMKEVRILDNNENTLSLTKNLFSEPYEGQQGTMVELFHIDRGGDKCVMGCEGGGLASVSCSYDYDVVFIKRRFPYILEQTNTYENGLETTTEYLEFDPISGVPTNILTKDEVNGQMITLTVPAFRIPEYSDMGPKSINPGTKNLLTAIAKQKTIKNPEISGNENVISQSVNTFKKNLTVRAYNTTTERYENITSNINFWNADKTYTWAGDLDNFGLYDASKITAFDFTPNATNDARWRPGGEVTLVDEQLNVLESRTFVKRYSATKYGFDNRYGIANVSNANYESFTYCGFEGQVQMTASITHFEGEVTGGELQYPSDGTLNAHTGNFMAKVSQGTVYPAFTSFVQADADGTELGLQRGRTYTARVWVHKNSSDNAAIIVQLNGYTSVLSTSNTITTFSKTKGGARHVTAGDWVLLNIEIEVPVDFQPISGSAYDLKIELQNTGSGAAYFDDLQFHPVDVAFSASVYDPNTGLKIAQLDNYNFATKFVYDKAGRVIETWQEVENIGFVKVSEQQYQYAR